MKRFKVKHLMLCEVVAWRIVEAQTFEDAIEQVRAIETVTASGACDYEIVSDVAIKELSIKEDTTL